MTCSPTGQCTVTSGSGAGGATTSGGTQTTGSACPDVNVTFDKVVPTVMLLIDQSGSMTTSFGSGTRWSTVHDALLDPTTGIVKTLESDVRFGLALFTSNNGFSGGTCPVLTQVSINVGNYSAIKATFDAAQPEDDTPTGESIAAVAKELAAYTQPGPKVIVLATDGEPDTCSTPDPNPAPGAQQASINAAQAAFGQQIQTFIISVGNETGQMLLQAVANAGAGLPTDGSKGNATYYQANDQASLYSAFQTIINGVRPCTFTLNGTVDPSQAANGTVMLDGQKLTYGDPNGWKLDSPTEVELTGSACQTIQDGEHNLNVSFPCGAVVPN